MKSLSEVASYFRDAKRQTSTRWSAKCPCHEDNKSSLSISPIDIGIGVVCYAGCNTKDILDAVGLTFDDLTKDDIVEARREQWKQDQAAGRGRKAPATTNKSSGGARPMAPAAKKERVPAHKDSLQVGGTSHGQTITAVYEYQDAEGRVVAKVGRTTGKEFPVISLDGGSWWWGDSGHNDLLYRLPEALKAIKIGQPVYIVEGEKDVETLRSLGLTATTNKGGGKFKWTERQAKQLQGIIAYIIPDNDNTGKVQSQMLLRLLRNVAKEVRIVNLTRQDAFQVPEKGDVSDLVQALGNYKALSVLEELVAKSPVLARTVKDGDYMAFYEGVDGCSIRSACTYGFSADKAERKLADFVALPVEQVLVDDGSDVDDYATSADRMQGQRYEWAIDGWSASGRKLRRIRLGAEEFEGMKWPMRYWGLDAIVADGNGVAQKLLRFMKAAGAAAAVRRTTYTHTGWREIDGKMCFLHGSGAIGTEGVDVRLEMGLNRYDLDGLKSDSLDIDKSAALPMCQAATMAALTVVPLRVSVPIIGYLFLSPLVHFLKQRDMRPRVIPFVRGKSGEGKTTYISLVLNHFGTAFSYAATQPASFEDSGPAMEKKLYILKDLPLYIDDWKSVADPKKMSVRRGLMENTIRMVCDGLKRSRMSAEMTARRDYPARSLCLMSGEELPSETGDSNIARLFVVNIEAGDVPLPTSKADEARKDRMEDLWRQARAGLLSENMKEYITYLASIADTLPDKLEEMYHELYGQARKHMGQNVPHARLPDAAAFLMLGIRMMLEYMQQKGGIFQDFTAEEMQSMVDSYWEALSENSAKQATMMRTQTPTQIFVSTLRDEILSGRGMLLDGGAPQKVTPLGILGYRDGANLYLIPGQAIKQVTESLRMQGTALPVGKNALLGQLKEEGISVTAGDATTMQVKRGGIPHGRYLVIPRKYLEECAEEEKQLTLVDDTEENPF